jgi:hypothetical protein
MAEGSSLLPGAAPSLRPGSKKTGRRVYIGIPISTIAIGATLDQNVPVLEDFKLNRGYLSVAAQVLDVGNIRVGTKPLNVSSNPISGNVFSEQSINNELSGYVATPGTGITLTVTNNTAAGVKLGGGFLGWAAL